MAAESRTYGRYTVEETNTGRVMYPEGITKGDVLAYYRRMGERMLAHLKGRPLTLRRFPNGIESDGFYQKRASSGMPRWIERRRVPAEEGPLQQVVCGNLAALIYLANLGTIEFHPLLARADLLDAPDLAILDLDPAPEQDFEAVRRAAFLVRELLDELDLTAFVKTTGSKGLHIVIPLRRELDTDSVRDCMHMAAEILADRHADLLTTEFRKADRKGRLFVDFLRNGYAQTAVAPYSLRAIPGAPVAMPVSWEAVTTLPAAGVATLRTIDTWLDASDPWQGMYRRRQSLKSRQGALRSLWQAASQGRGG